MAKRGREDRGDEWESDVQQALQELGAALRNRPDQKLRAMEALGALIAPDDDLYNVQRAVVEDEDAAFYLLELLQDESAAVGVGAARLVERLARHSAGATARLVAGPLVGLESAPERVRLNPVQSDLAAAGLLAPLTCMALSEHGAVREAGAGAAAALCSYNRDAKLAHLEELVQQLLAGNLKALEPADAVLDGMDCSGENMAGLLDGLIQPVLSALGSGAGQTAALSLMCTLCEQRPELKEDFREGGGTRSVAGLLQHGDLATQDLAARALWLLVQGHAGEQLGASGAALAGLDPSRLASNLVGLVQAAEADEEEARREDDAGSQPRRWDEGAAASDWGAAAPPPAASAGGDVCYAEEARALLSTLAEQYPAVQEMAEAQQVEVVAARTASGCCVM